MAVEKRPTHLKRDLWFVVLFTFVCTGVMIFLDAFDWIYIHSRQFETFHLDEFIYFFFLFSSLGMVWLLYRQYRHVVARKNHAKPSTVRPKKVSDIFFNSLSKIGVSVPERHRSPFSLIVMMYIVIVGIETFDMFLMHYLVSLPVYAEAIIDSLFLALAISPAFYFLFFRPMLQQAAIREQAEEELQNLNSELESRIAQRTSQLEDELAERMKTEIKLVEQQRQLMSLSTELTLVAEQERSTIAANLHDNIGHNLALSKNKLGLLQNVDSPGQGQELLDDIHQLIESSIRYIRALNFELSSPIIDNLPLNAALEWLAEDVLESNRIDYRLEIGDGEYPTDETSRGIILKAARELLVNIVKHSKASHVEVSLDASEEEIVVRIEDDGVGFDVMEDFTSFTGRQGIGLFTIRERMKRVGGRFSIRSQSGAGTMALLSLPKQEEKEER